MYLTFFQLIVEEDLQYKSFALRLDKDFRKPRSLGSENDDLETNPDDNNLFLYKRDSKNKIKREREEQFEASKLKLVFSEVDDTV